MQNQLWIVDVEGVTLMSKCKNCQKHVSAIDGFGNCGICNLKSEMIPILTRYALTEAAWRSHPQSIMSVHRPDPTYDKVCEDHRQSKRDLWEATDCEYNEDGFHDRMWTWRYAKVMARKCCHHLETDWIGNKAGNLMQELHAAELELFRAFGLEELYTSPDVYLKEHFPNLVKNESVGK